MSELALFLSIVGVNSLGFLVVNWTLNHILAGYR